MQKSGHRIEQQFMASDGDKLDISATESIFNAALALPFSKRSAYLAGICGEDAQLRRRVEGLLQVSDAPEGFLPEQPGVSPEPHAEPANLLAASLTEQPGDTIGRYNLREKIGEGGCGVVYMAEQEAPVRRKVALKVIKLGMDTKQVVARFEAERQALALMDHANIAKVLDAGATETGRPYFVMELVGGIKITDYCEQNNLSTRQRLDLFIQVCRAIQHAHQKGVIHRDIKPSNVLVATQDGVPVLKVIDFGIAKATQGKLTDQTVFTAFEQFIGTPAYMSPEQAQLGGLDVDTRSDIYSLGVLLYELLTGKTPFDSKELLAAGLDAMRRTIQEKEPPTPSTRLKQETEARSAASDKSALGTRHSSLDKDLDWIVMKCLEKERTRRYETANGLAHDIERHLNNEPVLAGPPSRLYRFQKMVRRNRVVAASAAAVATVLVFGIVISTWQAVRATRAEEKQSHLLEQAKTAQANEALEREKAQTEALKSEQVAQFLKDMLNGVGPSVARGRDTKMLQEILDRTAERVARDLNDQPLVAAELQYTIGMVYIALSDLRKAERMHRESLDVFRELLGNDSPEVAESLIGLAMAIYEEKKPETEALYKEAITIYRKRFPNGHIGLAVALEGLSNLFQFEGRLNEADALLEEALTVARKGDHRTLIARFLFHLAHARWVEGRTGEGEKLFIESIAGLREVDDPVMLAWALEELGHLLTKEGRFANAEEATKEALSIQQRLYPADSAYLRNTLLDLAHILTIEGKLAEAESAARSAIEIQSKRPADERAQSVWIGKILEDAGRREEAEWWYRKAVADESTRTPLGYFEAINNLMRTLLVQDKAQEVQVSYSEWLRILRDRLADDPVLAALLARLAPVLMEAGKFVDAESLARECLAMREKKLPDDWLTCNARSILGGCLLAQKKHAEAEPLLLSGYQGMMRRQGRIPAMGRSRIKEAIQRLVRLYQATGQSDKAAEWQTELAQWYRKEAARHRAAAEAGDAQAQSDLAWLLATCEEPTVRDGPGAVAWSEKAMAATDRRNLANLEILAAAYAEAGQFTKAVSAEKEAIALWKDGATQKNFAEWLEFYPEQVAKGVSLENEATTLLKDEPSQKHFAERLKLYESNTPCRD
jgi:eukaryotic-like serine/threonine-protein kinase